jgi:hypothetical protein
LIRVLITIWFVYQLRSFFIIFPWFLWFLLSHKMLGVISKIKWCIAKVSSPPTQHQ